MQGIGFTAPNSVGRYMSIVGGIDFVNRWYPTTATHIPQKKLAMYTEEYKQSDKNKELYFV